MTLLLLICCTIAFIVLSTTLLRLHPFLALILAALGFGLVLGMESGRVVENINTGFGQTLGEIGVVILAGTSHKFMVICLGDPNHTIMKQKPNYFV
jgi:GntP family gluconate:H+ symporter